MSDSGEGAGQGRLINSKGSMSFPVGETVQIWNDQNPPSPSLGTYLLQYESSNLTGTVSLDVTGGSPFPGLQNIKNNTSVSIRITSTVNGVPKVFALAPPDYVDPVYYDDLPPGYSTSGSDSRVLGTYVWTWTLSP